MLIKVKNLPLKNRHRSWKMNRRKNRKKKKGRGTGDCHPEPTSEPGSFPDTGTGQPGRKIPIPIGRRLYRRDNDSSKDNTIHYDKNGDQDDDSRKETPTRTMTGTRMGAGTAQCNADAISGAGTDTGTGGSHYPTIATDLTDGER